MNPQSGHVLSGTLGSSAETVYGGARAQERGQTDNGDDHRRYSKAFNDRVFFRRKEVDHSCDDVDANHRANCWDHFFLSGRHLSVSYRLLSISR